MIQPDPAPPRLYARTVEIDDPVRCVDWLPDSDAFAWIRQGDGMVGWGEVVRHKPSTLADAQEWWSGLVTQVVAVSELADPPAGAGFMAFGSFVFDPDNSAAQLGPGRAADGDRPPQRAGLADPDRHPVPARPGAADRVAGPSRRAGVTFADGALTGPEWEGAVAEAVRRIGAGELDKVVLARDLLAIAENDIDPRWLVARLAERYGRCWTYQVDGLVGATPEMLLRREAGLATSRVLAGTIRRDPATRPRPRLGGRAGAVQQGPGGARVRGAARWPRRSPRSARG